MMKVIAILLVASASAFQVPAKPAGSILSADRLQYTQYRPDGRCGKNFLLPSGEPAQCHGYGCCSNWGWCGTSAAHCKCNGCTDYHVRSDGRCGKNFLLPSGEPARCDAYGCCSPWGWCGTSTAHCNCNGCTDYRTRTSLTSDVARSATNFTTSGLQSTSNFTSAESPEEWARIVICSLRHHPLCYKGTSYRFEYWNCKFREYVNIKFKKIPTKDKYLYCSFIKILYN